MRAWERGTWSRARTRLARDDTGRAGYRGAMAAESDLARVVLPKNFLRPCLLLLLHESPAHGYELRERLRALGFSRDDPGRLYRALRALEDAELVRSAWQSSSGGPDRRTYELTRAGEERLREAIAELQAMHVVIDTFLRRCGESLAADASPGAGRR
jgi:PadR family transcriptional regulator PadR